MRAALRDRYGPPDVVELREVERPVPADDQVLVRVRSRRPSTGPTSTASHPSPAFVRLFIGLRAPRNHRLGLDVAGVVEAVGPAVTRFQPGDGVFADLYPYGMGAFAEYACAPEKAFEPIPDGDVVRGRGHASALGDPRDPGPAARATAERPGRATRS